MSTASLPRVNGHPRIHRAAVYARVSTHEQTPENQLSTEFAGVKENRKSTA